MPKYQITAQHFTTDKRICKTLDAANHDDALKIASMELEFEDYYVSGITEAISAASVASKDYPKVS